MELLLSTFKRRLSRETYIGSTSSPSCSLSCCSRIDLASRVSLAFVLRVRVAVAVALRPRRVLGLVAVFFSGSLDW